MEESEFTSWILKMARKKRETQTLEDLIANIDFDYDGPYDESPADDSHYAEYAKQGEEIGVGRVGIPLLNDIAAWDTLADGRDKTHLPIKGLMEIYPHIKAQGRDKHTAYIEKKINNAIKREVQRCPAECAKGADDATKDFVMRNLTEIRRYIGEEIQERAFKSITNPDPEIKRDRSIRDSFTSNMRSRSIDALRNLTHRLAVRDAAEELAATYLSANKSVKIRPTPELVRAMLTEWSAYIDHPTHRRIYDHYVQGGEKPENPSRSRDDRRNLEKARAAIFEKNPIFKKIGRKKFSRDDHDMLMFICGDIYARIDSIR